MPAPTDNRVLEVNTQRLRPSQALETLSEIATQQGNMSKINFTGIATKYEKDSLVQKSAAEILVGLIEIRKNEDILDLGCGTGHLTRKLREVTSGKVVGVDVSEGMIKEA